MYPKPWQGMHFDAGGISFNYNITIDRNTYSELAIVSLDEIHIGPPSLASRQCFIRPVGDQQMIWEEAGYLKTTTYDGNWKPLLLKITWDYTEPFAVYAYWKDNIEGIIVLDLEGNIVNQTERNDIQNQGSLTLSNIQIGSAYSQYNYYAHGTIYSVAAFSKVFDIEYVQNIVKNWYCENCYKNVDGIIMACIFDRLKYGDTPYDFINKQYATKMTSNASPRWKLMLPKDVGMV